MRYRFRLILLLLESSFLLSWLHAQPVYFDQFTSENGLSENVVYCIHQDSNGFIWAGTDFGLNRFDGYSFRQYHSSNSDTNTLSQSAIVTIFVSTDGTCWIGTNGGLNRFDLNTGKAERMLMPEIGTKYAVNHIAEFEDGGLVVVSGTTRIFRFNPPEKTFSIIRVPEGFQLSNTTVFDFGNMGKGVLFRSTGPGGAVGILNEKSASLELYQNNEIFPFAPNVSWNYYFRDISGNHFLASTQSRLFNVYSPDGNLMCSAPEEILNQPDFYVFAVKEINDYETWIGTNHGLLVYDSKTRQIRHQHLSGNNKSLPGNKEIRSVLKDRDGNAWLGTFGEGLLQCNNRPGPFKSISIQDISQNKLGRMIFGLFSWTDGMFAVETTYGNISLIRDNQVIKTIRTDELTLEHLVIMSTSKPVSSLSALQQKRLGEMEMEYGRIDPHQLYFPDDSTMIDAAQALNIYTGQKHTEFEIASNKTITDEKYHWVCSYDGLHRIDKRTFTDTVYQHVEGDSLSLSETYLYNMVEDANHNFWIGTKGGGLNYFMKSENRFIHYTTEDGLPDNVIYFLLPDDHGHLWLTTNKGISRFDPQTRSFSNYNRRDGLLNTEFNKNGGIRLSNGMIYLSGTSGLDYFHPDEVDTVRSIEKVHITEWRVNEVKQTSHAVTFRYDENDLSVYFTANDFIRPDMIYYRYRIAPAQQWTRTQGVNFARYSGIQPGNYAFEVQASYDNLHWTDSEKLTFSILAPWWKSWWFFACCGAFIIGLFYAVYKYRIEQLKRLQSMRTKISRDLHDEVGSTLSSIHVYSSVAEKALKNNPDTAMDALKQIHDNSRLVMENMSDIVWAINTGKNGEISLEKKLKNYGFELLTPLGINTKYHIETDAEKKLLHIEVRKNILLIAKEAMNNIARYSKANEAIIELRLQENQLHLNIRDNGIGFNALNGRQGNGLFNMQKRVESMGGKFVLETGSGMGTTISCTIPVANISDAWYKADH